MRADWKETSWKMGSCVPMAAAVGDFLISVPWKPVLKCSFLWVQHPEKSLCSQGRNSAQQQQHGVMRSQGRSHWDSCRECVGNICCFGTETLLPLLSCSSCFSRTALPVVRTNPTFGFSQRFEKLCRCILNSMDVENEPKVSRGVWFGVGRGWWLFLTLCVGIYLGNE